MDDDTAGAPMDRVVFGAETVSKHASTPRQRAELRHEAEMLAAVVHPGVVRLVEHRVGETADVLVTERVPALRMDHQPPTTAAGLAGLGAAVAAVLADLHRMGIAHGTMAASHVLIADARIVLCSFSAAGPVSEPARNRDVADWSRALSEALAMAPVSGSRVERRARAQLRGRLEAVRHEPVSAADLAADLAGLAGSAWGAPSSGVRPLPAHAGPGTEAEEADEADVGGPAPVRTWRDRVGDQTPDAPDVEVAPARRQVAAFVGVAIGLVVVAVWAVGFGPGSAAPPGDDRSGGSPAMSNTVATRSPAPQQARTPTPQPDLDIEAPPTVVTFGHLVEVDGVWFSVGQTGDIVRVGDWRCDGRPTAAILRPGSDRVAVFDRWSGPEERLGPWTTIEASGAVDLLASQADGCTLLYVIDEAGGRKQVEVAP